MKSAPKNWAIKSKGHVAKWTHFGPIMCRHFKKQNRRMIRRDGHNEIVEAVGHLPSGSKVLDLIMREEPPLNMFSPVPYWMMTEWELGGIEWYRTHPNYGNGVQHWKHYIKVFRTDETLEQDLYRTLAQLKRSSK